MGEKLSLVKEWIYKAEHDLGMAELALNNKPEFTDSICYHCQQTVEKLLKGYLVYLDIIFEKSHDLVYLLNLINEKQEIPTELFSIGESLNDYSVGIRYPDDWFEPSIDDAKEAYQLALLIKNYILTKITFVENE